VDILVTFVRVNARGKTQRDQRRVTGPLLNIGRGSKSQIHLPDARVALNHARITVAGSDVSVERAEGAFEVNGRPVDSARLAVGDVVEIGPYNILVEEPPAGLPLALAVSADENAARSGNLVRRALMRAPKLSKRRLSYLAFFGVLLLTLVIPLVPEFVDSRGPVEPGSMREMLREIVPVVAGNFAQAWNPGPVSRGHQVFGSDCRACHQFAFLQVRDSACVTCHKSIKEHVPRVELTGARGIAFMQTRCAECHRDHKGMQMAPRAQELCADCHADIKEAAREAQSGNVTDFVRDHPQFRVSLLDASHPDRIRRVRQAEPRPADMVERSNLKFNHALHLDPRGIRDPEERARILDCADCHQPGEGGRLIAPVTMEKHCQSCHSLAFEPKVTSRQVPHGSEAAVFTVLREFYARLVLGDVPPGVVPPPDLQRVRPGAEIDYQERQQALRIADERALRVLRELYETRDVCSTCHYISRDPATGYKVAPVRLNRVWMPMAMFSHAKHATEQCASCHDVARSKDAADIAMPNADRCRDCHVGARAVLGKVTSDCATCHRFHAGTGDWHAELQSILKKTPAPQAEKGKK
jgi:predicted CXXCH cytochrome family protein